MDSKYNYYTTKNMHQLFLQITKEGSKDSGEALENMLSDIDMLVESVYRDRMDRKNFYNQFLQFGVILYLLLMLLQFLLGVDTYLALLQIWYIKILVHIIIIANSYFILSGTKYFNENVGAE
jgi:small basic protein